MESTAIGLAESSLFKGVQVYSDFETGNGKNIHQASKHHLSLEVEGDFGAYSALLFLFTLDKEDCPASQRIFSIKNRDICFLSISDPKVETLRKRRILILSGYHAVEPGIWGSCGIVEYLLGKSEEIKKLAVKVLKTILKAFAEDL